MPYYADEEPEFDFAIWDVNMTEYKAIQTAKCEEAKAQQMEKKRIENKIHETMNLISTKYGMSLFMAAYIASHSMSNTYVASIYEGKSFTTVFGMREMAYIVSEIVPECIEEEKLRARKVERAPKILKIRIMNRVKSSIITKKWSSHKHGSQKRLWSSIKPTKRMELDQRCEKSHVGYNGYMNFYGACMTSKSQLDGEQSKWVSLFLTLFKEDGTIVSVTN